MMDAGYPAPVPVVGEGDIYLQDNTTFAPLVGSQVEVHADVLLSASTSFDQTYERSFEVDVGGMLTGAAVLLAAKWQPIGSHGYRITMAFGGVLASAINGFWKVHVKWSLKHDKAIDDQWDSFTLYVDLTTSGFVGQMAMRIIDP